MSKDLDIEEDPYATLIKSYSHSLFKPNPWMSNRREGNIYLAFNSWRTIGSDKKGWNNDKLVIQVSNI